GGRVPRDCVQMRPLVCDAAPGVVGDQPALGLGADLLRECDERRGVARPRVPDDEGAHAPTTTPAPPRRGSPAAARLPSSRRSTAATPPQNRLRRHQPTPSWPAAPSAYTNPSSLPPERWTWGSST